MRGLGLVVVMCLVAPGVSGAQTSVPVPRPFPGAGGPPSTSTPRPAPPAPAPAGVPKTTAPAEAVAPAPVGPDLPGVPPVYPTAEYLDSIDAGSGQRYYLYGTDAPFSDIVAYYKTVTRNGGREIYRTPGVHQFELGRFDEDRMAYPPSVVVKDYASDSSRGYLHVDGTNERWFRTIIQIVPPSPQ